MTGPMVCFCGVEAGYPHRADCPYPMYRGGITVEDAWLEAQKRRRIEIALRDDEKYARLDRAVDRADMARKKEKGE